METGRESISVRNYSKLSLMSNFFFDLFKQSANILRSIEKSQQMAKRLSPRILCGQFFCDDCVVCTRCCRPYTAKVDS